MTSHGLYLISTFIIFVLIVRGSPTYDKLISFECLYSNHFDKVRTVLRFSIWQYTDVQQSINKIRLNFCIWMDIFIHASNLSG